MSITWMSIIKLNTDCILRGLQANNCNISHLRLPGYLRWWNRQKPKHATDRTQTSDENRWRQQSPSEHAPFTDETWDPAKCITYSTDYYQRLVLESWFTNLEQTPLNRSQQLRHHTNDLLTKSSKTNYERTTGELTIWLTIDNCLTVTIDGSKRTNYWLRVFIANNITA